MPSIHATGILRVLAVLLAVSLVLPAAGGESARVKDPLTHPNLDPAWAKDISPQGQGKIEAGKDGLRIEVEPKCYALLKRKNGAPGSDEQPLRVSVYIESEKGFVLAPALHLYWDQNNLISLIFRGERHLSVRWLKDGKAEERRFDHALREGDGVYFRATLTSKTVYVDYSETGLEWTALCEVGGRPGAPGQGPARIMLGRGWEGDGDKAKNPELANDYFPDQPRKPIASLFRDFQIVEGSRALPDPIEMERHDTWEQMEEALEARSVPKKWLFLGPRPDPKFKLFSRKEGLEPDFTDDWNNVPKDETGRKFLSTTWDRPEGEAGSYVDLTELLDPKINVLAYARTEIDWPLDGTALVCFQCDGRAILWVNNQLLFRSGKRDRNRHNRIEYFFVPFKKGKNIVKIKISQATGPWGFHFRAERHDAGYRIRLQEKLLELYPEEARGWRGAEALLEIAQRYEELLDYPAADKAYATLIERFAHDDDNRTMALGARLQLHERLRAWDDLAKTARAYLAAYPGTLGAGEALRAVLVGECMAGRPDAAVALAEEAVKNAGRDSDAAVWAMRALSGALANAGNLNQACAALERLAALETAERLERIEAAIEAATLRFHAAHAAAALDKKPDPSLLPDACKAFESALALLGAAGGPQGQALQREGESLLRAGKPEQAVLAYLGAALFAYVCDDEESAPYFRLSRAYTRKEFGKDEQTGKPLDAGQARRELDRRRGAWMGDISWSTDDWVAIGPFGEDQEPDLARTPGLNARHKGLGGEKAWIKLDPAKGWHDLGRELRSILGECKGGACYIQREFEVGEDRQATLFVSARDGFKAWLDGEVAGENSAGGLLLDRGRVPLNLKKGKHRLLIRLPGPSDGLIAFRVHLGSEPEAAQELLERIWWLQGVSDPKNHYQHLYDLLQYAIWIRDKVPSQVALHLAEAVGLFYSAVSDHRHAVRWHAIERSFQAGAYADAADRCVRLIRRLRAWPPSVQGPAQEWQLASRGAQSLVAAGEAAAADDLLRDYIANHAGRAAERGVALVYRAALRWDFSQHMACEPFLVRALKELPPGHDYTDHVLRGFAFVENHRPERPLFTTDHTIQAQVEAAWRQLEAGNPDDVQRAMRNLGGVLRLNEPSLIRISDSPIRPLYVGVREYIRAMLGRLPEGPRAIYQETVRSSAEEQEQAALSAGDPSALEAVAAAYPYTPEASRALNHAGNLHLDRGDYAQAASVFGILLRDFKGMESVSEPLVAAKHAHALLVDGQWSAARTAIQRLAEQYGTSRVVVAGLPSTGADLAKRLAARLDQSEGAEGQRLIENALRFASTLRRSGAAPDAGAPAPGPLAWVASPFPSAGMDRARAGMVEVEYPGQASYPIVENGRAFVTTLESVQALDLKTGRPLWRRAWNADGCLMKDQFTGFPVSCPEVKEGRLYLRVQHGARTAIECLRTDDGKPVWSTAVVPELEGLVWLSDPVVAYGMAIAVFLRPADMNEHGVAAVDARTGRFRWKCMLATGNTGIRAYYHFYASTMQMGPPAVDGGVVYAPTGMGCLAALNAFTGEAVWVSGYPRMKLRNLDSSNSDVLGSAKARIMKILARGPASPVVGEDLVALLPKDASGLYLFDRRTGEVRWSQEAEDARFLAGLCDGKLLVVDNHVRALDMDTGRLAWSCGLGGDTLVGSPGYAGRVLYLPGAESMHLVDARSGRHLGRQPWDPRVGPVSNLLVTHRGIVGMGESHIVGIGLKGAAPVALPLEEGRLLAAEGKLDEAAARFAEAARNSSDEALSALSARVRVMAALERRDEALQDLDTLLGNQPEILAASGGWWQVGREVFAAALRTQLGQPAPKARRPPDGLQGMLAYAWQLDGDEPRIVFDATGPLDRFLVQTGNQLYMLRISDRFEVLWRNYVGPEIRQIELSTNRIAVASPSKLAVLDRQTGEVLWQTFTQDNRKTKSKSQRSGSFGRLALGTDTVAVTSGDRLNVFDLATGEKLWDDYRYGRSQLCLAYQDKELVEIATPQGHETALYAFGPRTGNRTRTVKLFERGEMNENQANLSPDGHKVVFRRKHAVMTCVDLAKGKIAWELNVPRLRAGPGYGYGLSWDHEGIRYFGEVQGGNERGWFTYHLNPETGNILHRLGGGNVYLSEKDRLQFRERWNEQLVRVDQSGKEAKDVWVFKYDRNQSEYHYFLNAFLSHDRSRLYVLYAYGYVSHVSHYVLRTFDWSSGQMLLEQFLPGTPVRQEGGGFENLSRVAGNLLLYGSHDGLFAFAPAGETRSDAAELLRKRLGEKDLSAGDRAEARRALSEVATVTVQSFLAPSGVKVDGDLSDWAGSEPIAMDRPEHFVPLGKNAAHGGPADLSAGFCTAWDHAGLYVSVDVRDDTFMPPGPGFELNSGDSIAVAINGLAWRYSGLDPKENVTCGIALVEGRTALDFRCSRDNEDLPRPEARVVRAPDGKGLRYELLLPWPLLRRDPQSRPGRYKELRLGVAVYDRDGAELKGALEWGAGVTSPRTDAYRMGILSLLDISEEKIERYRQVIALNPDDDEAIRYLELILTSKRGAGAAKERVAELEAFVKRHPKYETTAYVLARLLRLYADAGGDQDPMARAHAFAKAAGCPDAVVSAALGKSFSVWVRTDPKDPPSMIMVQFHTGGRAWSRRAYWGESRVDWGRSDSPERRRMGDLPKPGEWTRLSFLAHDLDMEQLDITGIAFTTWGGQTHFDRAACSTGGKETVLIDDEPPAQAKFDGNALAFVGDPKRFGAKSWTGGANKGLLNSHWYAGDGKAWLNFKDEALAQVRAEPDLDKRRDNFRQSARVLADTSSGMLWLNRLLQSFEDEQRVAARIRECEAYLKEQPDTVNALSVLQLLKDLYQGAGEKDPVARCEELMQTCRLPRDSRRAFYAQFVPAWTSWTVIGPFMATGERRGMDEAMPPEQNVDLAWKPEGPFTDPLEWFKTDFGKAVKGKPADGYSRIGAAVLDRFEDKRQRKELEQSSYFCYATVKFTAPSDRKALMLYGVNDTISILLNGRRVVSEERPGARKDDGSTSVRIKEGENELLLKVGVHHGPSHFIFRIADLNGRPFDDLKFEQPAE